MRYNNFELRCKLYAGYKEGYTVNYLKIFNFICCNLLKKAA